MNSDLDRSIANLTSCTCSKYHLQAHNLFSKPDTAPKNKTLSDQSKALVQVIREITPCADIRRIRRGRKVYQVPRIIPKEKRRLYGIRRLLSVRSDNSAEKEDIITVSPSLPKQSFGIAGSKSRVAMPPAQDLSTRQKDSNFTSKVEPFSFIESGPETKKRLSVTSHHFLRNKNPANRDKDRDTQKSVYFSRDSKPSNSPRFTSVLACKAKLCMQSFACETLYALSHKFIRVNTKAKDLEVENKFSYKKKSVGIPRHTPFYSFTRVESLSASTHVNKKNSSAENTIKPRTRRDFTSKVDNEKYQKQTLFRPQALPKQSFGWVSKFSLAHSLRRGIQTSFSSRGIAVHNKKSMYRTIFANRGSIGMSWWL